ILQAHILQPSDGLDDDVMTFASQDTAGDQNYFGFASDAPCSAYRLHTFACDVIRIEAVEINAAGHDRDLLPRSPIAIIDQLRDLFARGDHMVTACHDAVVAALE